MQKIIFPLFSARGGISRHPGENYYAFIGTVGHPDDGGLVAELTSVGTYSGFSSPNDGYGGPLDPADPADLADPGFSGRVEDPSNWTNDTNHGFPPGGESLFQSLFPCVFAVNAG